MVRPLVAKYHLEIISNSTDRAKNKVQKAKKAKIKSQILPHYRARICYSDSFEHLAVKCGKLTNTDNGRNIQSLR